MSGYRLFGAETSPYSIKVRAFLRYKNARFDWIPRSRETEAEFKNFASVPTVPLLLSPDGSANQDSTDIIATLEADHPEPSAVPTDPACCAIALILEDYADEWLNKCMFQMRWSRSPDREAAAQRVLHQLYSGKLPAKKKEAQDKIVERMNEQLPNVGASEANADVLSASFRRFAELLDAHLAKNLYLFGGRPSAADFALAGQFHQLLADPTSSEYLTDRAPFVAAWSMFMDAPKAGAPFKPLDELAETLLPIMKDEVAKTYLPWAAKNSENASKRRKAVKIDLEDGPFEQPTQKYAGKSFKAVKKALSKLADAEGLEAFLDASGAKPYFS